jgi:hypothetical protein
MAVAQAASAKPEETAMTEAKDNPLEQQLEQLRTHRDELRVKLNLAGKEARDLFDAAEKAWAKLEGKARLVEGESRKELRVVGATARELVRELRGAYQRISELL